jgi:recombination associated protein RdgC
MFNNLQVYRLPRNWNMTGEKLQELLAPEKFTPCTPSELTRQGWVSPRGNDQLVHVVGGQMLLQFETEKKLLPATVVNQVAKARAAELEEQQGFAPGKKAMKELKERVADELLPRAFPITSKTMVWIDPKNGWLVVDAASPAKADDVIKALLKCVDRMPIESLRVMRSPTATMTSWLEHDEAPAGFTVDMDAELRATGESKAAVRYVRHSLEPDEVKRHITAGKQCVRLAMTWDSKVSFVLTETLAIKKVKALDVLKSDHGSARDEQERFDGNFALMTGELAKLLADIVETLGGDCTDLASTEHPKPAAAAADQRQAAPSFASTAEDDPLYEQAKQIVLSNGKASISLVQRHLRVGYDRAAVLIELMERRGVVGPMMSSAARHIGSGVPT